VIPSVGVIVPNLNGIGHLPACLDSLRRLDYPPELVETIVLDNGSTDGSQVLLAEQYPWVRVLAEPQNLGFAEAVNRAAKATAADAVALLNNDMRVDPGWLRELVRLYDPEDGYPCVGGVILDWEGARVQFAEGIVNFHGAAAQVPFGEPLEQVRIEDGRELPFACGGSMLIDRRLFLEVGGFDEDYFAYFEDVDLGWRLILMGHGTRLAAGSRCYHRHHATGETLSRELRTRLYEANWLRTLLKNLSDENLPRLLTAALLLVSERARMDSEPSMSRARLDAVADVVESLRRIIERRHEVQARRRRTDHEIFLRFGRPFFPALADRPYLDAVERVIEAFRLDELFPAGEPFSSERQRLREEQHRLPRRAARRLRAGSDVCRSVPAVSFRVCLRSIAAGPPSPSEVRSRSQRSSSASRAVPLGLEAAAGDLLASRTRGSTTRGHTNSARTLSRSAAIRARSSSSSNSSVIARTQPSTSSAATARPKRRSATRSPSTSPRVVTVGSPAQK
jgi:GT2 family glycosyltransferase